MDCKLGSWIGLVKMENLQSVKAINEITLWLIKGTADHRRGL